LTAVSTLLGVDLNRMAWAAVSFTTGVGVAAGFEPPLQALSVRIASPAAASRRIIRAP